MSTLPEDAKAIPCPRCGGTAMEARDSESHGNHTLLTGYYRYCFNDKLIDDDCDLMGPTKPTSAEALAAWNAREAR